MAFYESATIIFPFTNFRFIDFNCASWVTKFFTMFFSSEHRPVSKNIFYNLYIFLATYFAYWNIIITSRQKLNQSTIVADATPVSSSVSSWRGCLSIRKHATILQIAMFKWLLWNQVPILALFLKLHFMETRFLWAFFIVYRRLQWKTNVSLLMFISLPHVSHVIVDVKTPCLIKKSTSSSLHLIMCIYVHILYS